MKRSILFFSALTLFAFSSIAQDDGYISEEGKYHIGHETKVKNPIPGEGMIKGTIHALHYLEHLPESTVDILDGRMVEVDKYGHFEFEVDAGTHDIKVSHEGFKDLVIKGVVITDGHETHINIGLAITEEEYNKRMKE